MMSEVSGVVRSMSIVPNAVAMPECGYSILCLSNYAGNYPQKRCPCSTLLRKRPLACTLRGYLANIIQPIWPILWRTTRLICGTCPLMINRMILYSHRTFLEHIDDDQKALSEIRRVLKPHGIAVLPVPIVSVKTIEYEQPNPHECGHVRSPGQDYFERYAQHFSTVDVMSSRDFPEEYQLYSYEDRTLWPTEQMPLREAMAGERHPDYVPICVV